MKSTSMNDKKPLGGVVCHYCHNPRHVRRDCRKLDKKNQRSLIVHESLNGSSASTMLVRSSKPNTSYFLFL